MTSLSMTAASLCCLLGSTAHAVDGTGDIDQSGSSVDMYIVDSSVSAIVSVLMNVTDARIEVSEAVRGRIQRQALNGTLDEVLAQLARYAELEWFLFNDVRYLSQSDEAISRVVRLGNLSVERATEALNGSGLESPTLSRTVTANGEAIILTGPPKLVAFAEIIIESIPDIQPIVVPEKQVFIRRGNVLGAEPVININREEDPQ